VSVDPALDAAARLGIDGHALLDRCQRSRRQGRQGALDHSNLHEGDAAIEEAATAISLAAFSTTGAVPPS
jgi:hypothetical protein